MGKLRVGINGFGRIGRILLRAGFDDVEIVGINNSSGTSADHAHFLKFDSTHGVYNKNVEATDEGIIVDGKKIPFSFTRNPEEIPWGDWGADVVFECTGVFRDSASNQAHIKAGAKKVIISAPAKADATFVYGINHKDYDPSQHNIVSNASCTTNCLAPVAKVLNDQFGIEKALMTTVHAFTNDQRVLDGSHKDLRRARTASASMIPTTTGAAKAVGLVLPELDGKIHGMAVRVPTPNVSLVDLNLVLQKSATAEAINQAFFDAAKGPLEGVLACEERPLVSIDYCGHPASSIVDTSLTTVMGDNFAKVMTWYDNEYGFSKRMVDLANYMNSVKAIG